MPESVQTEDSTRSDTLKRQYLRCQEWAEAAVKVQETVAESGFSTKTQDTFELIWHVIWRPGCCKHVSPDCEPARLEYRAAPIGSDPITRDDLLSQLTEAAYEATKDAAVKDDTYEATKDAATNSRRDVRR